MMDLDMVMEGKHVRVVYFACKYYSVRVVT